LLSPLDSTNADDDDDEEGGIERASDETGAAVGEEDVSITSTSDISVCVSFEGD
jgi:hypothetical protein